jgi:hypothetical protein
MKNAFLMQILDSFGDVQCLARSYNGVNYQSLGTMCLPEGRDPRRDYTSGTRLCFHCVPKVIRDKGETGNDKIHKTVEDWDAIIVPKGWLHVQCAEESSHQVTIRSP